MPAGARAVVPVAVALMVVIPVLGSLLLLAMVVYCSGPGSLGVAIVERDIRPCDMLGWRTPDDVNNGGSSVLVLLKGMVLRGFHQWLLLLEGQFRRMEWLVWSWFNNWRCITRDTWSAVRLPGGIEMLIRMCVGGA